MHDSIPTVTIPHRATPRTKSALVGGAFRKYSCPGGKGVGMIEVYSRARNYGGKNGVKPHV